MQYTREIFKITDNQIVFPIESYENIGDSLSSINYNFNALDIYTCNFEFSATNYWNSVYTLVNANSASWVDAINTFRETSACFQETYTIVSALSSLWLKPISLIYPYVFPIGGSTENIISTVTTWVNTNLPVLVGTCVNFIRGQELYVFSPQYNNINRTISKTQNQGIRTVTVGATCSCIKKGKWTVYGTGVVDCGSSSLNATLIDQFIDHFVGLKFRINEDNTAWVYDSALYN